MENGLAHWNGYKITYDLNAINQRISDCGLSQTKEMLLDVFSAKTVEWILNCLKEYAQKNNQ